MNEQCRSTNQPVLEKQKHWESSSAAFLEAFCSLLLGRTYIFTSVLNGLRDITTFTRHSLPHRRYFGPSCNLSSPTRRGKIEWRAKRASAREDSPTWTTAKILCFLLFVCKEHQSKGFGDSQLSCLSYTDKRATKLPPPPPPPTYATNTLYYQLRNHTFKLGVKGSGSLMLRGKALRIRFLIWMQLGGMTSQKLKW